MRLAGGSIAPELRPPLAAGAGAALVSALVSLPLTRRSPPLRLLGAYRIALGALCLQRGD